MKIFETNVMTPGEFKEAIKRTLNIRPNPQELGALVSLFDISKSGFVSVQAFMSTFTQMRVRLDSIKGTPDESQRIKVVIF